MVNGLIKTAILLFSQLYMHVPLGVVQMPLPNCFFFPMSFILVICISKRESFCYLTQKKKIPQ